MRCRRSCPQPTTPPKLLARYAGFERAQASIELIGALPLMLLAMLVCVQATLLACSVVFAQVAAGRAAAGLPRAQVVAVLPEAWRRGVRVQRRRDIVRVRVATPAIMPGAEDWLEVRASAVRSSS